MAKKMIKIEAAGFDELSKAIMKKAYRIEQGAPARLRRRLGELAEAEQKQTHLSYTKGYSKPQSGTKSTIIPEIASSGLSGEVGPHMHYNTYTEYGTRFMEAAPIVEPHRTTHLNLFKKDMEELLND